MLVADVAAPELDQSDVHHLRSVLRMRPGDRVSVTDGRGGWRLCSLTATGSALDIEGGPTFWPPPSPALTVAFALVKGDRPEWAVQKLTELGVDRIVLMHCDRSVVRWDGPRAATHLERLRMVSRQALMQSRRCWLPEIVGTLEFGAVVDGAGSGGALANPGGVPPSLATPAILVGPEGGWSPEEEGCGLPFVSLGTGILRTETAAVAAGVLMTALRSGLTRPA